MGKESGIAWTNATFNGWWGCTHASPGCDNCYAEKWAARSGVGWGPLAERRLAKDKTWNTPLKWDAEAKAAGTRKYVFSASMSDVMDPAVPQAWRDRLWALIDKTPNLTWLLLTKHPQLYDKQLPYSFAQNNVILGTTTENQFYYGIRWPHLSKAAGLRGLKTFISHEPAIGPLVPTMAERPYGRMLRGMEFVYPDWIITGGESGAVDQVRPYDFTWAFDLVRFGEKNGVAVFVKQMGDVPILMDTEDVRENAPEVTSIALQDLKNLWPEGTHFGNRTKNPALNGLHVLLDGRKGEEPSEWPEGIRIRQFPQ